MTAKNIEKTVKNYMWNAVLNGEHIDCGEVHLTSLAEDALATFAHLNIDAGPEADVWDWAYEISVRYDAQLAS